MKTQTERLAVIETEIVTIKESLTEHKEEQRKDFDLVFKKLDNLGNKFAGKWVEKVSMGALISIISALIIFILTK